MLALLYVGCRNAFLHVTLFLLQCLHQLLLYTSSFSTTLQALWERSHESVVLTSPNPLLPHYSNCCPTVGLVCFYATKQASCLCLLAERNFRIPSENKPFINLCVTLLYSVHNNPGLYFVHLSPFTKTGHNLMLLFLILMAQ